VFRRGRGFKDRRHPYILAPIVVRRERPRMVIPQERDFENGKTLSERNSRPPVRNEERSPITAMASCLFLTSPLSKVPSSIFSFQDSMPSQTSQTSFYYYTSRKMVHSAASRWNYDLDEQR